MVAGVQCGTAAARFGEGFMERQRRFSQEEKGPGNRRQGGGGWGAPLKKRSDARRAGFLAKRRVGVHNFCLGKNTGREV
jgi:hypothetical protein